MNKIVMLCLSAYFGWVCGTLSYIYFGFVGGLIGISIGILLGIFFGWFWKEWK